MDAQAVRICDPRKTRILDAEPVETRQLPESPASVERVRGAGWRLDDLWLPAVVLRQEALRHNLDRLALWSRDHGVELAPHGKTAMSPHLWAAQLERGAWGISAANAAQARAMHRYGVPRVIIANEVVDPGQLSWLAAALADPGFEPLVWADSVAGVALMEKHLAGAPRPLPVLVELGVSGRRTGLRDMPDAVDLARRVAGSDRLTLAGIAGYEGTLPQVRTEDAPSRARAWLGRLTRLAVRVDAAGLFGEVPEIVVTAGGSGFPDLVASAFAAMPALSRPVRFVVRAGAYVSHDDGFYDRVSPLRSGSGPDPLLPAVSCFARVLSCPEPGRALIGVGKRDVAFDIDLPTVRSLPSARVTELNDHHGFVAFEEGELAVGDVVELGLSHPCTVFDKWPLIPVLDANDHVVDAIRTLF